MADRLDDELSQSMRTEIEMEGATIRGRMPTFENLTKAIVHPSQIDATGMDGKRIPADIRHPTGQIFTLPTGQQIVLVPANEIVEFLSDDTVVGFDTNERRERNPDFESVYAEKLAKYGSRRVPHLMSGSVDPHRVMRSQSAENFKQTAQPFSHERRVASHYLGNGFHVLLGLKQQYQPDKSSFGTYEMTADGPVRVDEKEPKTKSIPIVFYSDPNKPIEYEATVGPYDRERAERGLEQISEKASVPSLGMDLLNRPDRVARQKGMGTYDTGMSFYNVNRDEIKPELIPGFTGRDVIAGYKTAKASQRNKTPAPVERSAPAPIEPAPAPEPTPEPPSSFQGFEMPVVDTPKGRRRVAPRRLSEPQDLTDDFLSKEMRLK